MAGGQAGPHKLLSASGNAAAGMDRHQALDQKLISSMPQNCRSYINSLEKFDLLANKSVHKMNKKPK